MIDWSWIVENWQQIGQLLVDHIQLVTLGLCIGMLLAGAMVLLALWQPGLARPMIYVCGLLFTIPSLALFILIMPFTGLSKTTAVIGLSLYALLIVLQNTLAGLASNPADVLEEARALGYTRMQRFLGVELPLALPALFGGLTNNLGYFGGTGDGYCLDWSRWTGPAVHYRAGSKFHHTCGGQPGPDRDVGVMF